MMKNITKMLAIIGLLLEGTGLASIVAAKKDNVEVYQEASKTAGVLGKLKKGEELEALERKGMYWKVKHDKGEGFVSVLQVQHRAGDSKSLSKAIRAAAQQSRTTDEVQGTRARSAVMGVRGLSDSDTVSAAGNVSPNIRIIYAMEDNVVPAEKIEELGNEIFAEVERRANKR